MTIVEEIQTSSSSTELRSVPPFEYPDLSVVGVTLGSAQLVEVSALSLGDSPRTGGEDVDHTASLMECEAPLPPILVHRPTMRIVDGLHRVRAAQAKGQRMIEAFLLDGSAESAFAAATAANLGNGLPLSLPDRRRAAARILQSHAHWSDRSISRLAGLSAKTIRAIRSRHETAPAVGSRTGRDGRLRPINSATGRRAAAEYIAAHPQCSLRDAAKYAGISPNTVRDVRDRLKRGEDPVRCQTRTGPLTNRPATARPTHRPPVVSQTSETSSTAVRPLLASLSRDPELRMSDSGRELLRWLHTHTVDDVDVVALMATMPNHRQAQLAEIAARCSVSWSVIAHEMSSHGAARTTR